MLHVDPDIIRQPVIASVILETEALINIERAKVDAVTGEILVGVSQDKCIEVKKAFENRGAKVFILKMPVIKNDDECVHCGACISICPTGTFRFEDSLVVADPSKCVQCGACITACPQRALKLALK